MQIYDFFIEKSSILLFFFYKNEDKDNIPLPRFTANSLKYMAIDNVGKRKMFEKCLR